MSIKRFKPNYLITSSIADCLIKIGEARERAEHLPVSPRVMASLRKTSRFYTTHYSTLIEGNELGPEQVKEVVELKGHFPGREREEREVRGYYKALEQVEKWNKERVSISTEVIQRLHAIVIGGGKLKVKSSNYRDGQNVIRDGATGAIVYLPPEAKDVSGLMKSLIDWVNIQAEKVPAPIVAAIFHYQFATIHPYYDGNGRTARLLTNLILYLSGYGLKGIYSLEEYYAKNLSSYYQALDVGDSHNYYEGRAKADITGWVEYFVCGMAVSFEKVVQHMKEASTKNRVDYYEIIRDLGPEKRKALELFQDYAVVSSAQIRKHFDFKPRTNAALCKKWVDEGFLKIVDPANKSRSYRLADKYEELIK